MPVLPMILVLAMIMFVSLSAFVLKGKSAEGGLRRHEDDEQMQALRDARRRSNGGRTTYSGTTHGYEV
ncbi:MAG: hypothetical protein U5K81_02075 [Trueperaceae bacterium]|nr:hypothetical protein [Trueperaceae bacterium]